MLTNKDLDEVFTHYPKIHKKILKTAEGRLKLVTKRNKELAETKEEDKEGEEENRLKVIYFICNNCRNSCGIIG